MQKNRINGYYVTDCLETYIGSLALQYHITLIIFQYRQTSLYVRDRDQKIKLAYNEFAYKKTKYTHKLVDRFLKKANFQSHICEITNKKTAYDKGRQYIFRYED